MPSARAGHQRRSLLVAGSVVGASLLLGYCFAPPPHGSVPSTNETPASWVRPLEAASDASSRDVSTRSAGSSEICPFPAPRPAPRLDGQVMRAAYDERAALPGRVAPTTATPPSATRSAALGVPSSAGGSPHASGSSPASAGRANRARSAASPGASGRDDAAPALS